MSITSLLRVGSVNIGEDGRHICKIGYVSYDHLRAALRRDVVNFPLAEFMISSWRCVPSANLLRLAGSRLDSFQNWSTKRRVSNGVVSTRYGGRIGCCTETSNVGPATGANKVKEEVSVEVKEGREEEWVVRVSELDKFWQDNQDGGVRKGHDNGAPPSQTPKGLTSAVFSSVEGQIEQGRPGELRQTSEDGRPISEEVCEKINEPFLAFVKYVLNSDRYLSLSKTGRGCRNIET